ncbi:type IV pilus secretin PilQ [Thermosulfurimonas marina]|uniref:Type IV pilus secretin PilQ n=1 Tax=Thermosulfurimonas marina TaxID=2047767 RepID=A0A6H1WQS5_9BACT|nr:type IV pilus secretin PilQ [Thermosulfurimonas marina]QJA05567.1 type IV pilus secretin PilQ [Thermosulfurimonas marina]
MRFLRVWGIWIVLAAAALGWGLAQAADYHLLQDVEITGSPDQASVVFLFEDQLPPYTVSAKEGGQGVVLNFQKARIGKTDWIRKLNKRTLIHSIDVGTEGEGLRIEFSTRQPVTYRVKEEGKGLILVLQRQSPEESAQKVQKKGAAWYEKVKIPEISEENIEVPLTRGKYTGTPISVDFQNADIHAVLRLLAKVGGVNIVASDTVKGTVTLRMENVPWDQVLDMVLASKGLGMIRVGNVIRVAPLEELREQARRIREIKEEQGREEEVAPLKTVYFQINYAKAEDVAEQLKKILSDRGDVTAEPRTNQVILKDVPKVIREARELIEKIDQPTKQVLIEARIVEVQDSYEHKLGIRWSGAGWRLSQHTFTGVSPQTSLSLEDNLAAAQDTGVGTGTVNIGIDPGAIVDLGVAGTSRLGFTFGHVSRESALFLDTQLSALESEGVARIISAPRVLTEDNQEAEIKQGFRIPYLRQTQDGISTEFVDAALRLKVTPHVTPDNRITLEVEIEKNAPDFGRQVNGVPSIVTRYAKSRVIVSNGDTLVIGGIIERNLSNSQGKVPGLSKIPGAGNLFKNRQRSFSKNELMVFITPRIVSADIEGL